MKELINAYCVICMFILYHPPIYRILRYGFISRPPFPKNFMAITNIMGKNNIQIDISLLIIEILFLTLIFIILLNEYRNANNSSKWLSLYLHTIIVRNCLNVGKKQLYSILINTN